MDKRMALLVFSVLWFTTSPGFALIPVEDLPNEINTRMTYLNSVQSLLKEVTMVQNQLRQLQYEAKNLQGLSGQQWDNTEAALNQLNQAITQRHALVYAMANMDQQFKQHYPGYHQTATADYSSDYQSWVKTNQATMNGVLDQLQASYQQQQQEQTMDQILADRARHSVGRMQALQVANEIAAEQIAQLQKLKATIMAQANAQAEYYAYQSQKDAVQQQSVDAVIQKSKSQFPKYRENSQFGLIPPFPHGR